MKRAVALLTVITLALFACLPSGAALAVNSVSEQTPLGSSSARIHNIELAADAVNGYYLPYGSSFSFNDIVGARTSDRGYKTALNGRGTKVVGGGVAQVASTIYLALKNVGGITYDEISTYGERYNQDYVSSAADAILVDYDRGVDFAFTNYADDMVLEVYTAGDFLYCTLTFDVGASDPVDGTLISSASIVLSGTSALLANVELAADTISGTELSANAEFSFNDIVGARSEENGYLPAVNGRGVKVVGGGVGQVASVIWMAIKNVDNVSIIEKSTYGNRYNQSYVANASDAILIDYSAGTDFSFRYIGSGSMQIYTYVDGSILKCDLYQSSDTLAWW